jgi:hypothetical protein
MQVELAYQPKLVDLSALESLVHLERLVLDRCKRLHADRAIPTLPQLRVLRANSCAPVPSLEFLARFERLEQFNFVATNVEDGDMLPLLRLRRVGFDDKRHYSHKQVEIERLMNERDR